MNRPRRTAVIAIHGVANQEPGETARAVALRIAAPMPTSARGEERWHVRSPSLPTDRGPLDDALEQGATALGSAFRTAVVTDVPVASDQHVDVHEIAWADLSRPGRSPLAVLFAIVALLLELPSLGRRELVAAGLPKELREDLEGATEAIKEILLPSVAMGVVLTLSLISLPCSRDRAETIRLVLSLAHVLVMPIGAPWFAARRLQPWPGERWSFGFLSVCVGAALGACTWWILPSEWLAWLPAAEIVGVGAIATSASLSRWVTGRTELLRARGVVALLVLVWVIGVVGHAVHVTLGDAPSLGIALARQMVYATTFAIEFAYASASTGFGVASFFALRAFAPYAWQIVRSYGTAYRKVHVLRTAAMSHALPLVMMVFLALPLVSGLLAVLSSNDLLPRTLVRLQILRSLEAFADTGGAPTHLRDVLVALVRGSGTHLLSLSLLAAAMIFGVVAFVTVPVIRVELGAYADPVDEREKRPARQRDVLDRWLERGTGVIANWIRNGALLVAALLTLGYALEVVIWLLDWVPALEVVFDRPRDLWHACRDYLGLDPAMSLWDTAARSSGAIVLAMGVGLAGSTAFLALPGRLREITSPLWPVLDVILDVTRYLDRDRRTRILARAHSVFEGVMAQEYDRIVIVSHSQGTLIAADLLRMTRDVRRERRTPTVDLVTMGSPLANLYHRLLPGSFAWVEKAVANRSELGVGSWTNFYGGGDAVGRTVRDTELLQRLRAAAARESEDDITWLQETNVGSIGHVSYFDPEAGPAETIRTLLRAAVLGGART